MRIILLWLAVFFINGCASTTTSSYAVKPPFMVNKKFLVSQGFFGKKTHYDALNRYAVDLVMPQGEPVCAVKAGVVNSLHATAATLSEGGESNFVRIVHENKVISDYQHLLPGSITVSVGQQLKEGECFAKVGNTGKSTGPHLHFALLHRMRDELVSVPFQFIDPQGQRYTPEYLGWVRN